MCFVLRSLIAFSVGFARNNAMEGARFHEPGSLDFALLNPHFHFPGGRCPPGLTTI